MPKLRSSVSSSGCSAGPAERLLAEHAAVVRARDRQRFVLDSEPSETLYLVRSGVFLLRAAASGTRTQILSILYPGDLVRSRALPALQNASLVAAASGSEVLRLRWSAVKALADANPALAEFLVDRMSDLAARFALRGALLAAFTGEERVAALVAEVAVRMGASAGEGRIFDMPLTRTDIADHVALNADTVSRIVTRLRARGLIAPMGQKRFICPDLSELQRYCDTIAIRTDTMGPDIGMGSGPAPLA